MLETYIKNKGITKTIIHDKKHNHNHINEIKWVADYDGDRAKVKLNLNDNGHNKHLNFSLDNHDLAKILNIPSIDLPLERRLKRDFYKPCNEPIIYRIELENEKGPSFLPIEYEESRPSSSPILQMLENSSYLPSPASNEELLIPLSIRKNTSGDFTFTPRRRHRKYKTHKTYRIFRHKKSSRRSSRRTTNSSRRSSR
jgi:hypothetical protein